MLMKIPTRAMNLIDLAVINSIRPSWVSSEKSVNSCVFINLLYLLKMVFRAYLEMYLKLCI